ncbi:MAG: hypothetical protein GY853_16655 [PVC group bacterium]|nr:hypothetical protein [PVC group bacterium]
MAQTKQTKTKKTTSKIAQTKETKAELFARLGTARVQKVLDSLRILGNCSSTASYEYTADEIEKAFAHIRTAVDNCEAKFFKTTQKADKFSF